MADIISVDDPAFPPVVDSVIAGRQVLVYNLPYASEAAVDAPPLHSPHGGAIYAIADDEDIARVLSQLRDLGCAMSAGRKWSPSEQFERLREAGLVTGSYDRAAYLGNGRFRIEQGG